MEVDSSAEVSKTDPADETEDLTTSTQIQNKYSFFFKGGTANAPKVIVTNYLESIHKISSFQTVERFWQIYDHLKRPNDIKYSTEYHIFKEGISPTWEDPNNALGGKWMLKLKKGIASRYWEEVVLAIIGEQFDVGAEICGAVISIRTNEDIISVWNKTADNKEAVDKIRDQLRRILRIPAVLPIEYKRHQDSLTDRSSYRNPTMVWRETRNSQGDNSAGFGGHSHGHGGGNREGGGGGGGNYYNKGPQTGSTKPYGNSSYNRSSSYQGTGASSAGTGTGTGAGGGARGQQDRDGSSAPYKAARSFSDGAPSERERDSHHPFHQGERDKGSGSGAHPYNRDRGATGAAAGGAAAAAGGGGGSGGAWGKRTGGAVSGSARDESGGTATGAGGRDHASAWRSGPGRAGAGDDAAPAAKDKAEGEWDSFDASIYQDYSSKCGDLFAASPTKRASIGTGDEKSLLTNIKSLRDIQIKGNHSTVAGQTMNPALSDCNVYIFGNSVFRHYSFSLLAFLEGLEHDISFNRTAEKSSCVRSGPMSSCNHYSQTSQTLIRFFWNIKMGNTTCDDLRRDVCYGVDDDNTTNCYVKLFAGSSARDVLLLGNIPANTQLWCQHRLNTMGSLRELFDNYGKPNITSVEMVAAMAEMVLSVFPGRILWVSYPVLNCPAGDVNCPASLNGLIQQVNRMVRDGVKMAVERSGSGSNRMVYVNLAPLQLESLREYSDLVHHPGPLSEKIVRLLARVLNSLR